MGNRICTIDGCERPHNARGLCKPHYKYAERHGSLPPRQRVIPIEERFWQKVALSAEPDGCLLWMAALDPHGYGRFGTTTGTVFAHRFAFELVVGPIPEGLQLDHLCRVHSCVNPAHLEPVTGHENTIRGISGSAINARKTVCVHGHPFDEENTSYLTRGGRQCRACWRKKAADKAVLRRLTSSMPGPDSPVPGGDIQMAELGSRI